MSQCFRIQLLASLLLFAFALQGEVAAQPPGMPEDLVSPDNIEVIDAGLEKWYVYQPSETGMLFIFAHDIAIPTFPGTDTPSLPLHRIGIGIDCFQEGADVDYSEPQARAGLNPQYRVAVFPVTEGETYHFRFYMMGSDRRDVDLPNKFKILTTFATGEAPTHPF